MRSGAARRRILAARALGVLLVALPVAGRLAAGCEDLPTDAASTTRYRARAQGPRCEGMFIAPVSGEAGAVVGEQGIALVSLTFGEVSYRLDQDSELVIRLSAPATQVTHVRGVGTPLRKHYRLDADWAAGQRELHVPLGDVIQPERLAPDLIGVFGFRDLPGAVRGFVPVYAAASGLQTSGQGIIALIRPSVDVSNVAWRVSAAGSSPPDWTPVDDGEGLVPEGTVLAIPLGRALPGPRATLDVSYYLNGAPRSLPFVLLAP